MTLRHPTLNRIILNLARSKEFPQGSSRHGYDLVAPLDSQGHIDLAAWKASRADCTVRRFWEGQDDETGMLVYKGGSGKRSRWIFDYDPELPDDDEAGFLFGAHAFVPGEYVSIRGGDGKMHTFVVRSVTPLP
ncbi:MAG TPA: hypothetical protein VFS63_11755 [Pseudolabrys sp.]|jgi:hypothetical protein|nr:hypothetical protein [Pseudolabrys sp.]